MPALIMGAVPASETGAANSLNTLMRSIGTSTASAVAGVILAEMTINLGPATLPSENGFKAVMAAGAGAALLAFVVAILIPRRGAAAAMVPVTPEPVAVPAALERALVTVPSSGGNGLEPAVAGVQGGGTDEFPSGGIPVTGRVRAAEGAPVAGAAVTLISFEGRQVGRSVAHGDGGYALNAPGAGSYVLIASADGHQPEASTIVVGGEPSAYDVLLSGMSGLAGVVRSEDGGTPVSGAVVIATDVRGDVVATGQTDDQGEFSITGLVPGTMTLAVNSPRHRPHALPVEIGGTGVTRIEVGLRPGAQVRGTVRGAGAPLGGARVTLVDGAGNTVATTTTGADGVYAFSDLDSGPYTVIATGYPPKATKLTVAGGGVDGHDIDLAHNTE
jgi:hypothetical protein